MRILETAKNNKFYVANNHLFYYDNECMIYLGEERQKEYWEEEKLKMYKTGVLYTEYCGYEKVSKMVFFGNDGRRLFTIDTDNMPFDVNVYKSKADNIRALVFDNGVLISMKNADNQGKFIYYFYDKTFITSYDFDLLIEKVRELSRTKEYTNMVLSQLENDSDNTNQDFKFV